MQQAKASLSRLNDHFLENWPEGLLALDSNNQIVMASEKAQTILGFQENKIIGRNIHDVVCAKSRGYSHDVKHCPLHQNDNEPTRFKSAVWLHARGENIGVDYRIFCVEESSARQRVITFFDNSNLAHNQEELNNFAEYVDHSPAPIGEFDRDGQLIYGNTALQNLMLDLDFNELGIPRLFPENLPDLCEQVCSSMESLNPVEVNIEGTWFAWHLHPLRKNSGVSVIGYGFDISKQKQMQDVLEKERAAARRDFYAKMVHELRTPLNAIIGFSQILMRRTESLLSERDFFQLKSIHTAGLQLNQMVTDTLDASKIDAGLMDVNNSSFIVGEVLQEIEAQMSTLASAKKLDYQVYCQSDLAIFSDQAKVRQIIVNLVSNAIKYTKRGSVNVSVVACEDGELGECICFAVKDTGVGISAEQQQNLFKQYERVEREENRDIQGTGIGLSLVKDLVDLLGGKVSVQSVLNQGSEFSVILPLNENR